MVEVLEAGGGGGGGGVMVVVVPWWWCVWLGASSKYHYNYLLREIIYVLLIGWLPRSWL